MYLIQHSADLFVKIIDCFKPSWTQFMSLKTTFLSKPSMYVKLIIIIKSLFWVNWDSNKKAK